MTKIETALLRGVVLLLFGGGAGDAPAEPPVGPLQTPAARAAGLQPPPNPAGKPPSRATPMPVPFVSAKTNMVSSKTVVEPGSLSIAGLTFSQSQTQREMSVGVSVQFFSALPGPFEVQCFFVAKNDTTRSRYIFNVVAEESKKATYQGEIHSGTLLGATRDWVGIPYSLPVSLPEDGGKLIDLAGKSVGTDTKTASKIEGWILRVVYEGLVLKVDSNQPHLAELANRFPKVFDAVAKAP